MSGNIDFDVGNYGVEELVSIIDAINKIPLSKADIIEITKKYIDKYDNKPKFKKFFQDVRIKLLNEKDRGINESIFSSTSLEKLKEEQIVGDRYKTMDGMLDETRNVPVELKFPNITSKPTHFIQGRLNPTHIDTTTKVVSFDSKDRPILDPIAVNCRDVDGNILVDNGNNGERLDSATNYTTTIDQINNVVQLSLSNVEIPHTWFVFSLSYGTNYFMTNHNNSPCIIEEGNYTSGDDIIDTINEAVDVDISRNLKFQYHSRQGRVSIKNEGLEPVTIKWYSPMAELAFCVEGGAIGQKIDYNLGWLLGFRLPEYTILPTDRIVSEALLDLHGPRYLIIALDDFCNNKPNQSLIVNKTNKSTFKLPSYYNRVTMGDGCEVPDFNTKRTGCRASAPNLDLISNLTKNQIYTVDQIKLAMNGKSADRYSPPATSDFLYRLPILRNISDPNNSSTVFTNLSFDLKRIYYGPVNLSKFRIRLLDNRGFLINLNNNDWSFSIKMTILKSYGAMTSNDVLKKQKQETYDAVKAALDAN